MWGAGGEMGHTISNQWILSSSNQLLPFGVNENPDRNHTLPI